MQQQHPQKAKRRVNNFIAINVQTADGGGGSGDADAISAPRVDVIDVSNAPLVASGSMPPAAKRRRLDDAARLTMPTVGDADNNDADDADVGGAPGYDARNPWEPSDFQDAAWDAEDYGGCMGEVQKAGECFGCRFLGVHAPGSAGRNEAGVDRSRLEQLQRNMALAVSAANLNQACLALADEYEHNVRAPANRMLKAGQRPLPPWTAATIRQHLTRHDKNPAFRTIRVLNQLDAIAELAFEAAPEEHARKRKPNGKAARRVNPEQWRIYKEATELNHRLLTTNFKSMTGAWDDMKSYLHTNGSDFVDPSQKNSFHYVNQMNPVHR